MLLPVQTQKPKHTQNKLENNSKESRGNPALFFISRKIDKFAT